MLRRAIATPTLPRMDSNAASAALDGASPDGHLWRMPVWVAPEHRVVLYWLPALGVPATKYAAWGDALRASGVGLVVHEWRGTGSSSLRARRGIDWNYRTLLEHDLAAGLGAARSALPGRRWLLGGHSLGGQFAALLLAGDPQRAEGLVLTATGVPRADTFAAPSRWLVGGVARSLAPITSLVGHFPGDRLGWAGREAAGVMRDWGRTVLTGRYDDLGLAGDPEAALAALERPVLAITFADDWWVPAASIDALLAKLGPGPRRLERFDGARLGAAADHFRWMRHPAAVSGVVADWAESQLR